MIAITIITATIVPVIVPIIIAAIIIPQSHPGAKVVGRIPGHDLLMVSIGPGGGHVDGHAAIEIDTDVIRQVAA